MNDDESMGRFDDRGWMSTLRPWGATQARRVADPEVVAKPTRRQFSAEYRLLILEEAERCTRNDQSQMWIRSISSSEISSGRRL